MVKSPYIDSNGIKRGAWSEEEDNRLRACIQRHGHMTWRLVPFYAGLARCSKSCRLRWVNYLKPDLNRQCFTKHERDLIVKLHAQHGNKWSTIASYFRGRTDNDVKNYWYGHINRQSNRRLKVSSKVMMKNKQSPHKEDEHYRNSSDDDHQILNHASSNFTVRVPNPESSRESLHHSQLDNQADSSVEAIERLDNNGCQEMMVESNNVDDPSTVIASDTDESLSSNNKLGFDGNFWSEFFRDIDNDNALVEKDHQLNSLPDEHEGVDLLSMLFPAFEDSINLKRPFVK